MKPLMLAIVIASAVFLGYLYLAQGEPSPSEAEKTTINQVILLPTIHGNHVRKHEYYNLQRLTQFITEIKADIICAEITPHSFANIIAARRDRRVELFPEYTKVILMLDKKLNYQIIPCSAWRADRNFQTVGIAAMDKAHYALIAKALDKYSGQGKRILITFGGGHIDGLLARLRKRNDINIIDYRPEIIKQRDAYLRQMAE